MYHPIQLLCDVLDVSVSFKKLQEASGFDDDCEDMLQQSIVRLKQIGSYFNQKEKNQTAYKHDFPYCQNRHFN